MKIELELWHLIVLLLTFFGACSAAGKLLLTQTQKHLDGRFEALDTTTATNQQQVAHRLTGLEAASRAEREQWQRVERELLNLKAELPLHYVRREDYVQAIATIMAKLDAMALRFENIILRSKA